jgi:hypothetical protein
MYHPKSSRRWDNLKWKNTRNITTPPNNAGGWWSERINLWPTTTHGSQRPRNIKRLECRITIDGVHTIHKEGTENWRYRLMAEELPIFDVCRFETKTDIPDWTKEQNGEEETIDEFNTEIEQTKGQTKETTMELGSAMVEAEGQIDGEGINEGVVEGAVVGACEGAFEGMFGGAWEGAAELDVTADLTGTTQIMGTTNLTGEVELGSPEIPVIPFIVDPTKAKTTWKMKTRYTKDYGTHSNTEGTGTWKYDGTKEAGENPTWTKGKHIISAVLWKTITQLMNTVTAKPTEAAGALMADADLRWALDNRVTRKNEFLLKANNIEYMKGEIIFLDIWWKNDDRRQTTVEWNITIDTKLEINFY